MGRRSLDESTRLNRFLLLLQFSAPVHKEPFSQSRRRFVLSPGDAPFFIKFIQSCQAVTIPTVMNEITKRLLRGRIEGHIRNLTFSYFVHVQIINAVPESMPGKAGDDLKQAGNKIAYDALRRAINGNFLPFFRGSDREEIDARPWVVHGQRSSNTGNTGLPLGWSVVRNRQPSISTCFEDDFTRSVTLKLPRISPIQLRQLVVGSLRDEPGLSCHVDLLSCMRAGAGKNEMRSVATALEKRFPYYSNDWFATEWNEEPNNIDILSKFREPLRIQTFTGPLNTAGWTSKFLEILVVETAIVYVPVLGVSMITLIVLTVLNIMGRIR